MLMIDTGNTLLSKQHKRATPKTPEASSQSAKYKAKKKPLATPAKNAGVVAAEALLEILVQVLPAPKKRVTTGD